MKKFFILILSYLITGLPSIAANNTAAYMNLDWWKNFNDDYLVQNLVKVYESNYDLKDAALKVKANEQVVRMQFAQELPGVSFSGDIYRDFQAARRQYGDLEISKYSQNNYYLPITAGYEIDIWGKNRLKTKSKKQQLEIIKQEERSTYISLTSAFATDYFNLIKTDEMLRLQNELVNVQQQITQMIKDKNKIGLAPITAVLQQEENLNTLKQEQNIYNKTKEVLINNLNVYLSESNKDIQRNSYKNLTLLKNIPEEYNSNIIENRPDYLEQEANIKRIGFDVRVAKKEFLPTFTIYGQIGLNAYKLSNLFNNPSQFLSAGIAPNWDLFSGGRKLAMLKMEKFRYEEALNSFQKTYLDAISEINSSLVDYKTSNRNYNEAQEKLAKERKLYNLAMDNRNIGNGNNVDVLFAREVYLTIKKESVSNKINSLISAIGLYKSVGGVNLYDINKSDNL